MRVLGFAFRSFLSYNITTEMLGVYTIAISVVMVFVTILSSGMTVTVSKLTAESIVLNKEDDAHKIVTSSLIINIILSVIIVVFILLSKNLFLLTLNDNTVYYLLLSMLPAIIFTGLYTPFRGYLWGKENYLKVSIVELFEQIVRIGSCFILFLHINKQNNILATGRSLSIACLLSTVLGIIFYFTSKGKLKYDKTKTMPLLKRSSTITAVRIASSLMQPFLAILLPMRLVSAGHTQAQALSYLGTAMGMTVPLLMIPSTIIGSLAMALIPKISSLVKQNKKAELIKQINSSIIFTICCTFVVIPIFIALGEVITPLLFNGNVLAGTYLKNASWLMVTMGVSQLTTSILNSLGLEVKTFKYYIISSVFLLGAVIFLPQFVGIYALLFGLGISSAIVAILNIYKINKTLGSKKYFIKETLYVILICIPTIYLTKFSYTLLILIFPKAVAMLLVSALAFVAFILLLTVPNIIDVEFIESYLPKRKQKKPTLKKATSKLV